MLKKLLIFILLITPIILFSSEHASSGDMVHKMTNLVFQIGVIIFAAKFGGILFEKLKMPSVLGELVAGIIIGPYLLGSIPFPGFPHGLFHLVHGASFPINPELYGIATIASILLLFTAGLETDINLFLQYSLAGSLVGIGGIVASFFIGAYTGVLLLGLPFMSPTCLFLGVMSTATSVGITARILSERRSMDSPEGVTILAGAVIDDVLGIILLAIILGIAVASGDNAHNGVEWSKIGIIAAKAIGVWLGFTVLGLLLAHKISNSLKIFKNRFVITVLALGLALLLAGIFEKAGLAMIIGAYVMGLTLSKTDLSYVIQEALHPLEVFLVPVFFTVMGMLVNLKSFLSKETIVLGIIYSIGAVLAKMLGCGLPAAFLNFNKLGIVRIGLGMVPRGEIALIIAGIGLSNGLLDENIFGVSIMMTLITTVVAPPLLNQVLKKPQKGTRKDPKTPEKETTRFHFASAELTDLLEENVIKYFREEGFFIHMIDLDSKIYYIRKDETFIQLFRESQDLVFKTDVSDVLFIKNILYEALLKLHEIISKVKSMAKPEKMRKTLTTSKTTKTKVHLGKFIDPNCIIMNMKAKNKEEVIKELIEILHKQGKISEKDRVFEAVMIREKSMSTGLQHGIAMPHARTSGAISVSMAIGFVRDGIDFDSIDGLPSKIFVMLISSRNPSDPHIQILAGLGALLNKEENIEKLLSLKTPVGVMDFLSS